MINRWLRRSVLASLRLLPDAQRARIGDELAATIQTLASDARAKGGTAAERAYLTRELADIVRHAWRARAEPRVAAGPLLRRYCDKFRPGEREELGDFVFQSWLSQDLESKYTEAEARALARKQAQATLQQMQQSARQLSEAAHAIEPWCPLRSIPGELAGMAVRAWREVLDTNVTGVWHCTRAVLPEMRARRSGRIINVASIDGQKGFAKLVPQCAAKAAVIGLTRALAKECWQDGIAVTAICPAEVDKSVAWGSEPKERPGAPSVKLVPADIARAAVFLASPEADAVTGVTLDVYGIGFLAS